MRISINHIGLLLFGLLSVISLEAQDKVVKMKKKDIRMAEFHSMYPDSYLDTVKLDKAFVLNEYVSVNFEKGVSFSMQRFNPAYLQKPIFNPEFYEISFTKYNNFINSMPYFGLKLAFAYGHEGYSFKENTEKHTISRLEGAEDCVYDIVEMPLLSHFHVDGLHFKMYAEVGPYIGYRTGIHRIGPDVIPEQEFSFLPYDNQFDYGLRGGAGFAIVTSPLEFFVNAKLRFSTNPLFEPDYSSPYYYRYAYPTDLIISAGITFQLTKRTGNTRAMLKEEARKIVYGK